MPTFESRVALQKLLQGAMELLVDIVPPRSAFFELTPAWI